MTPKGYTVRADRKRPANRPPAEPCPKCKRTLSIRGVKVNENKRKFWQLFCACGQTWEIDR